MTFQTAKLPRQPPPVVRRTVRGVQRACACEGHARTGGACAACYQRRHGLLRRVAVNTTPLNDAPPIVHDVLRSSGLPLDEATRAFMETRFGHDCSQVRVHADAEAADAARAVNAEAYTIGADVIFASGQYQPARETGRRRLAP